MRLRYNFAVSVGAVEIESEMTAARQERGLVETRVSEARRGAPDRRRSGSVVR